MTRIDSYKPEEDEYLRKNYKSQSNKEIGESIGRTENSVKARLKQLSLYRLKPQYINQKGVLRKGYKYTLHSDWNTKLDTPCPLLRECFRCECLFPSIDFYIDNKSGPADILGTKRTRFCPECVTKNFMDIDPRRRMIFAARQRAKRDGRECTLKPEDIKMPDDCPILGIPLESSTAERRKTSAETDNSHSLDRVNNEGGYTPDNILVVSNKANKLKRDGDIQDILPVMAYLIEAEMLSDYLHHKDHKPYADRNADELITMLNEYLSHVSKQNTPQR